MPYNCSGYTQQKRGENDREDTYEKNAAIQDRGTVRSFAVSIMRIVVWAPVRETETIPPLGPELTAHLSGIGNTAALRTSCSAWQLLYDVLRDRGLRPGAVRFTQNGKPYFPSGRIWFSISHSGAVCAVSVADVPTGVDVERVRAQYRPALVDRVLSKTERAIFDGDFAGLWCRKESIAKLTGQGVGSHPARIDTLNERYQIRQAAFLYQEAQYALAAAFPAGGPEPEMISRLSGDAF